MKKPNIFPLQVTIEDRTQNKYWCALLNVLCKIVQNKVQVELKKKMVKKEFSAGVNMCQINVALCTVTFKLNLAV